MIPEQFIEEYYKRNPHPEDEYTSKKPEHIVLITLIGKYNIKTIFEIGTWIGYATQLMASHPNVTKVKTIDDNRSFINKNKKIEVEFIASNHYKPKEDEYYDMIFIDDGHTYDEVKRDTNLALKFKPKIIVWHDYIDCEGVSRYVDELKAEGRNIKFVKDVNIAYMVIE